MTKCLLSYLFQAQPCLQSMMGLLRSVVRDKIGENDYVICTPNRRRKLRVCHINMLKLYHCRPALELNGMCSPIAALSRLEVEGVDDADCLKVI